MKIKKISRRSFVGTVYNFHCLPNENYFSEGMLVHNCYKSNTFTEPTNMSFDMFKQIIDKFPPTLTQVAFGITGIQTNPDFIKMMEYCREIGVIPNFTLSGIDLTPELLDKSTKFAGAVAVSAYQADKNVCYNTVEKYIKAGVKQTNIHLMVSQETLTFVWDVLLDYHQDSRLKNLNAIVFLGVKPKGRAKEDYTSLTKKEYADLVQKCLREEIPFGFDSCSAPKFEAAIKDTAFDIPFKAKEQLLQCSESCESSAFSSYINVDGQYWHCSFSEDEDLWSPVNVLTADNFLDVWYSDEAVKFRETLLGSEVDGCRYCITFPEINK